MKRMKKLVSILLCVVISMVVLAGCGGNKYEDSKYLGTWKATSASSGGISIAPELALGGEMSVNLEASGKCTLSIAGDETSGKWNETDNGFNVADQFDFVVDGDTATVEYEGITLIFER